MKIAVNDFVKRQTEESQFTYYKGSWNDIVTRTLEAFEEGNFSEGYREGIILVHMPEWEVDLFYTYVNFPMFEGMKLSVEYKKIDGREYEPAQLKVQILEPKQSCKFVDIVLYRADVLEEDDDRSTDAEWEIISINGRLQEEEIPIPPLTIVRNWKHLEGGTEMKGKTIEEVLEMLCESILYQNNIKVGV